MATAEADAQAEAMEVEQPEAEVEEDGAAQAGASGKEEAVEDGCARLHLSSKDFIKCPEGKVQTWLAKTSGIGIQKCFKLKQWNFAFVTVRKEEIEAFTKAIAGTTFRSHPVDVKEGHKRDANQRRPRGEEDPNAKRRKVQKDWPEGYVPTLKDIRDKEKSHKGAGVDKTVKQKAAPLLEYDYATQLGMKETYVKSAVRAFTKQAKLKSEEHGSTVEWTEPEWSLRTKAPVHCGCPLDPIIGTPAEHLEGYRNKCEFTIGHNAAGELEVGFVRKIQDDMQPLIDSAEDIPHVPAVMKRFASVVRDCVKASPFPVFDRRREAKSGVWRLVMCRLSANGSMMVMVQTASFPEEKREALTKPLVEALLAADLGVTSVFLQLNDAASDAAQPGAPLIHVHGEERLKMPLLGLTFEIGPLSFFQTNPITCALLYEKALSWLSPDSKALALDVCCGVGTIGLCMAKRCRKVVGLELVPEAVESAKQNAALNGISNASYHAGKAEDVLPDLLPKLLAELGPDCEVAAVLDPPRPGLHKDVLQALRDCAQLTRIVYISCNPESLAEDVVKLTAASREGEDPFVPVRAVAVDMFPHTVHVEMVLLLERKSRVLEPPPLTPKPEAADEAAAAAGTAGDGK